MDLENLCKKTREICLDVADFMRTQQEKIQTDHIENKGIHDFVTYVDKTSEEKLIHALQPLLPEAGFIAEEGTTTKRGKVFNWIIDPLDGTTNYIHKLSPYAISIALMENDEIVMGVVYEVGLKECFYSWKGAPAYLNGREISVSNAESIQDSLIATGFPFTNYSQLDRFMRSLKYFIENTHGVRRPGSAATDLAYVACGRFDAFYEYSLHAWDVAAGAFLVQQAGGKVCDFSMGDNFIFGEQIVASNSKVHEEFAIQVNRYMVK
jgi:myo-inositol-1(or 4)-monophosphatase